MNSLDPSALKVPSAFEIQDGYTRRYLTSLTISLFINLAVLWCLYTMPTWFSFLLSWQSASQDVEIDKAPPQLVLLERVPDQPSRPKTFLETDAHQASREKPKNAEFYSEHNTVASQPNSTPVKSADLPSSDGQNTKTMATENVSALKKPPSPSLPAPEEISKPIEKVSPAPQPQSKSTPEILKPNDQALLRPPLEKTIPNIEPQTQTSRSASHPQTSPSPAVPSSQREVLASKSKLEGGVPRTGKALAFNSEESPFASYDKKVIAKIGTYWQYQLVDRYKGEKIGEVVVSFKLMADGTVTDLRTTRNTANSVLAGWCIQAIEKSAPFAAFPESMKALVGEYREGTITFAY